MDSPYEEEPSTLPNKAANEKITQKDDEDTSLSHRNLLDSQQNHEEEGSLKRAGEELDNVEEKRSKNENKEYKDVFPVLRQYCLSYTDLSSLGKYARCSKQCNLEIQMFKFPYRIELKELDDGLLVVLRFRGTDEEETEMFELTDDGMVEVCRHIKRQYKFYGTKPSEFVVNMKSWPTEVANMQLIARTQDWHVTMYNSMYNQFMEFARTKQCKDENGDIIPMKLYLKDCEQVDDQVIIGPEFFKFGFIEDLLKLDISTKFRMDREDLHNCEFQNLKVTSWTDLTALRQIATMDLRGKCKITISLKPVDPMTFHIEDLYPRARYRLGYNSRYCKFSANYLVHGKIARRGKYLKLKSVPDVFTQEYFSDSDDTDIDTDDEGDICVDGEDENDSSDEEVEHSCEDSEHSDEED